MPRRSSLRRACWGVEYATVRHRWRLVASGPGGRHRIGGEHLFGIHRVEPIALVAELARDFDAALFGDYRTHFVRTQHPQHRNDAFRRTGTAERDRSRLEQAHVVFVIEAVQDRAGIESEQAYGDLLLALVALGRDRGYDAESAARVAARRRIVAIRAVEGLA